MKRFLDFIWETIKMVVISLVIIIPIRYFLIQPFYVKGASMEPTFYDHEYLIVDEISYRFHEPERGDVIVFRYPNDPKEFFIKRVIGLPGETIEFKDGQIYVFNKKHPVGFLLDEKYLPKDLKTYSWSKQKVVVDSDSYFVLGDNRHASKDSRVFGPVNKKFLIGRVFFRGWPFDRITTFPEIKY